MAERAAAGLMLFTDARIGAWPAPSISDCPKRMTYGPCGGVRPDGECEIGGLACPFANGPVPQWAPVLPAGGAGLSLAAQTLRAALDRGGVVVADFPARALDAASLRECASALAGVDAVLIGDAPQHRVQFPPAYRAALVQAAGATPWVGLNTRDRNRVALEAELAALADLGAAAVHCVTGDHPLNGNRADARPVFDLDSTRLAALAAGHGVVVSVAESPAAPPTEERPARLISKERAGAGVCLINHCGGVEAVTEFVRRARALGSRAAMIACIPFVCDAGSAAQLASFRDPGTEPARYAGILTAPDPRMAGIAAAVELGRRMLDTGLLAGVNLSGGPADGAEPAFAEALAEAAAALAS